MKRLALAVLLSCCYISAVFADTGSDVSRKFLSCDQLNGDAAGASAEPVLIKPDDGSGTSADIRLGDWLTFVVPQDKVSSFFAGKNANQPSPVLYLNHLAIDDLEWIKGSCGRLTAHFVRTEHSRNFFGLLLKNGSGINIGIGAKDSGSVINFSKVNIAFTENWKRAVWCIEVLALLIAIGYWGWTTGLLRDIPRTVPDQAAPDNSDTSKAGQAEAGPDKKGASKSEVHLPYSLARVQMAFWFFLTVAAFSGIWLLTGDLSSIPSSLLGLIGISSATTIMSAVIDTTNDNNSASVQKSRGFIRDLLSDNGHVSFHRFQMAVWTLVLGGIFVYQVISNFTMPDFDTQLLGLMGVASGTYLGFKIPLAAKA